MLSCNDSASSSLLLVHYAVCMSGSCMDPFSIVVIHDYCSIFMSNHNNRRVHRLLIKPIAGFQLSLRMSQRRRIANCTIRIDIELSYTIYGNSWWIHSIRYTLVNNRNSEKLSLIYNRVLSRWLYYINRRKRMTSSCINLGSHTVLDIIKAGAYVASYSQLRYHFWNYIIKLRGDFNQ